MRRLSVIELMTMNKTTQPTGETEASARDLSDEDSRPVLEGDFGSEDGISPQTALRFNGDAAVSQVIERSIGDAY
jgi:hypothetical protein